MSEPERAVALRVTGLRRSFPVGLGFARRAVLRSVDLALESGSTLGLVGPNGSGKSTLLRLLAGVDRPTAGDVEVLGGSPADARVRARLAYLPEDSPFPPELSAVAVLDLLAALAGLPRRASRARGLDMLARVGLGAVARRPLRTYSRGMLRRFGLAQAFLGEPRVLLLDEPTAGLDAPGFAVIEDLLTEARSRGAAIVLSSHLVSDVHGHCDRWAVLLGGRLAAQGGPEDLVPSGGSLSLEVEGLDARDVDDLEAWIEAHGGRLCAVRPGVRTLLELYARHGAPPGAGDGGE